MARYTTTETFGPYSDDAEDAHVVIIANGGALAIEGLTSTGEAAPIEGSPFSADAAIGVVVKNGRFTVTPSGGAVYEWSV